MQIFSEIYVRGISITIFYFWGSGISDVRFDQNLNRIKHYLNETKEEYFWFESILKPRIYLKYILPILVHKLHRIVFLKLSFSKNTYLSKQFIRNICYLNIYKCCIYINVLYLNIYKYCIYINILYLNIYKYYIHISVFYLNIYKYYIYINVLYFPKYILYWKYILSILIHKRVSNCIS